MTISEHDWQRLRRMMSAANLGGVLERNRDLFVQRFDDFFRTYTEKLAPVRGEFSPTDVDMKALAAVHEHNRPKVEALLQAAAFNCSAEIMAMIWAVLSGAKIERLEYTYERRRTSEVRVELMFPEGTVVPFAGKDHWDAAVLRLMPLSKADGAPLIEGFYPLHFPRVETDFLWMLRVLDWVAEFGGGGAFCPSVIDPERIVETANAIVDAVKREWLAAERGGPLFSARTDPAAEARARDLLMADAAVVLSLTQEGRRHRKRGRFYRQLRSASTSSLLMVRKELERVLRNPSPEYTADEIAEMQDELWAIQELLREAA